MSRSNNIATTVSLALLTILAAALRFLKLGLPFQTSDNTEIAVRILDHEGYRWMLDEYYGVLITLVVKWWVGICSSLGMCITEFWWRTPVALTGTLQVPLTYFFLRRFGSGRRGAMAGAAFMAVLPVHVFLSRYLWGFEVLGLFALTLAFWSLLSFLEDPTLRKGLIASTFAGLYAISHVNIFPFLPCVVAAAVMLGQGRRVLDRLRPLATRLVWLVPAVLLFFAHGPFFRLLQKQTRFGFYLPHHFPGMIWNTGLPLALLIVTLVLLGVVPRELRSRRAGFLAAAGIIYASPLLLGAPPGVTIARGYLMLGTCLLLMAAALTLDRLMAPGRSRLWLAATVLCWLATTWGATTSLFENQRLGFPLCITPFQGALQRDRGFKTAGLIVRTHVPPDATVFALDDRLEPPVLRYYFARTGIAFYDLHPDALIGEFHAAKDNVDVVVCNAYARPHVERSGRFSLKTAIHQGGFPVLWIYGTDRISIPVATADVVEGNARFDREYAPRVSLR